MSGFREYDVCTRCGCTRRDHNCTDSGKRDGTCFADLTSNLHGRGYEDEKYRCDSFSQNKKLIDTWKNPERYAILVKKQQSRIESIKKRWESERRSLTEVEQ